MANDSAPFATLRPVPGRDDALVLGLQGDLELFTVPHAHKVADVALENEAIRFLLADLSQVEFLDSSGLGFLISTAHHLKERKGAVCAFGATVFVHRTFMISRMDRVIRLFATEAEAVAALVD